MSKQSLTFLFVGIIFLERVLIFMVVDMYTGMAIIHRPFVSKDESLTKNGSGYLYLDIFR